MLGVTRRPARPSPHFAKKHGGAGPRKLGGPSTGVAPFTPQITGYTPSLRRLQPKDEELLRQPRQTQLALARKCRECGMKLTAVQATIHSCTAVLEWNFGTEQLISSYAGGDVPHIREAVVGFRIAVLGARTLTPTAYDRLCDAWDFVRSDFSHALDLPSREALSVGTNLILVALRGREIVAFLSVARVSKGFLINETSVFQGGFTDHGSTAVPVSLGVELVWVRRPHRRKNLATALLDAARWQLAGLGALTPVDLRKVAFSQPTEMGFALAQKYLHPAWAGGVVVYTLPT